ncbi:MAG: hypothetical protein NVS3B21_09200 [Acidimicrobiales bacterium]
MSSSAITISCEECTMRDTSACADCFVTFLCDRDPEDGIIIDAAEARAVRMLGAVGLAPKLRHARRVG